MEALPISAVIITLNEEQNLERCLKSLQGVVQEVVIVDSYSTDGTEQIAQKYGARFIQAEWEGYSATKNKGNALANHDWILSMDADECLSDALRSSINELMPGDRTVYRFARLNNYCGTWIRHAGWYPDMKVRLFNRKFCSWEGAYVHEKLVYPTDHQVQTLKGDLHHYTYYTKEEHIERLKKYTRLAVERDGRPKGGMLIGALSVAFKFLKMYVFKAGFLDGKAGLQLCRISAMAKWWAYSA